MQEKVVSAGDRLLEQIGHHLESNADANRLTAVSTNIAYIAGVLGNALILLNF